MWVRITANPGAGFHTFWSLDNNISFTQLGTVGNNTVVFNVDNSAGTNIFDPGTGWAYYAISYSGTTGTAVCKRISDSSFTVATQSNGGGGVAGSWVFCDESALDQHMNVDIAHMMVWSVSTTTSQLRQQAASAVPLSTVGLYFWNPGHDRNHPGKDFSGHGNDFTLANSFTNGLATPIDPGAPRVFVPGTRSIISVPALFAAAT